MTEWNSRKRVLATLRHQEPDRVPYDLASTHVTGIAMGAYQRLRAYLGLEPEEGRFADVPQQIAMPSEDLLERLEVDTRGLFPLTSHNWNVEAQLRDAGENWAYEDEWGLTHHFPKENGLWYTVVGHPLESAPPEPASIDAHRWPAAGNPERVAGLREQALAARAAGKVVCLKGLCGGIFEMAQRLRGMENTMLDTMVYPAMSERLIGRIADLKIAFWQMALAELGDVVDVVLEGDDYGTQESQLISPEQFRASYKPHVRRVIEAIRRAAPDVFVLFHSCGNVRPVLPDFIEIGVDILNPVHITASGMEPKQLKKDFGRDLSFWGGGVETQSVLPTGSPAAVRENVRRNLEALAPGGGFVFNTVHNIQSEVPPENVMAMWEALMEFGRY